MCSDRIVELPTQFQMLGMLSRPDFMPLAVRGTRVSDGELAVFAQNAVPFLFVAQQLHRFA